MYLGFIIVTEPCSPFTFFFCFMCFLGKHFLLITVYFSSNMQIDINIPELNPEMVRAYKLTYLFCWRQLSIKPFLSSGCLSYRNPYGTCKRFISYLCWWRKACQGAYIRYSSIYLHPPTAFFDYTTWDCWLLIRSVFKAPWGKAHLLVFHFSLLEPEKYWNLWTGVTMGRWAPSSILEQ